MWRRRRCCSSCNGTRGTGRVGILNLQRRRLGQERNWWLRGSCRGLRSVGRRFISRVKVRGCGRNWWVMG